MKKEDILGYSFLLPSLIFFTLFVFYPIAWSFRLSFFEWKVFNEQFVGFQNYVRVLNDPFFWNAFKNTLLYVIVTVPGQIIFALFFAVILNEKIKGRGIFRTIYYIPVVTSWAVVSTVWKMMLDPGKYGFINYILLSIGAINKPISWLGTPGLAMLPIMALCIWKGIGWSMVIFLAALQTVPTVLYDVAKIDGANRWNRFRHITLPLISPTIAMVTALLTIGAFNIFPQVYILTGGGPIGTTDSLLTHQYRQSFSSLDFGYGTAMGYLILPIILSINILQIKYLSKRVEY